MEPISRWKVVWMLAIALWSRSALAHVGHGAVDSGNLLDGLLHPLTGLDHVVAMVAVGLWGAQLGTPAIWVLPVAFPLVMAVGGFVGLIGVELPFVSQGIAVSGIVLGGAVALAFRPRLGLQALSWWRLQSCTDTRTARLCRSAGRR